MSIYIVPRVVFLVSLSLSAIISGTIALDLPFPVVDPFHQGEFLAASTAILNGAPFEEHPFTVHGAVDFLPALVVSAFAPSQELILSYTLALYPLISILAVLFTMSAILRVAKIFDVQGLALAPIFLLVPFCVGWRDLFFAVSLYAFSVTLVNRGGGGIGILQQITLGLTIAFGVYWSFNRGVAAVAAFGPVMIWLALADQRFLVSITSTLCGFLLFGAILPGIGVTSYIENFQVLLQTSSQWSMAPSLNQTLLTGLMFSVFLLSVAGGTIYLKLQSFRTDRETILIALALASTVYLKIGLGRIDEIHMRMAIWLPLLIISLTASWDRSPTRVGVVPLVLAAAVSSGLVVVLGSQAISLAAVSAIALIFLGLFTAERLKIYLSFGLILVSFSVVFAAAGLFWIKFQDARYAWLPDIGQLPVAEEAATAGVLWSSRQLLESDASCVFDLVNNGIINAVTNLPPCSRFSYPVYANQDFEAQLIRDLRSSNPTAIVYSSDFWSYSIDGRSMVERFPHLDGEILELYPTLACKFGYCVRFRD